MEKEVEKREKRKYVKRVPQVVTKARCGHVSKEGRYFTCEQCQPELPSDNGDWDYFNLTEED